MPVDTLVQGSCGEAENRTKQSAQAIPPEDCHLKRLYYQLYSSSAHTSVPKDISHIIKAVASYRADYASTVYAE